MSLVVASTAFGITYAGSRWGGGYGWIASLWGFLYVQVFVVVVASVDELARRRRHGPGGYRHPDDERRTRRRPLQVKTLIAAAGSHPCGPGAVEGDNRTRATLSPRRAG
ncbi:hypothetical protein ACFWRG_12420 [Micromonospora tulbaghiae]|uniref:hypothetical protein n=1 Tax=Micromonospora tulbaghiae TaxID=479978 RepID=UPI0036587298